MKISEIRIENLRGYVDQTIPVNDYTCLVGSNGAGKSTILCALCIFFRDTEHFINNVQFLQGEDFHRLNTGKPIRVTVTFTDLPAPAQVEFREYYRHGKLVVTAEAAYNAETKTADVKQYGQRLVMRDFRAFFAAEGDGKPVAYLKERYEEIKQKYTTLAEPGTKARMIEELRTHENAHPELCELVSSSDQFYGFSAGANRLAKYVQWVYVPAVKDASTEQTESKTTALGKLLARTVRSRVDFSEQLGELREDFIQKYTKLLNEKQASLSDLSSALGERLKDWAHPDARVRLEWRLPAERAVRVDEPVAQLSAGEGVFDGNLSRFGHGLQRCYLLALLQELSGNDATEGPRLILGVEEPELHQHPPQARHLADVLQRLTEKNSQVLVSTHSPYFVSGERFADVRMIKKDAATSCAVVSHLTMDQLARTIADARGDQAATPSATALKMQQALLPALNEMFFTRVVVLVEGLEDIAYITACFNLLGLWGEFRRQGCHLVSSDSKSHLINPLAITKLLGIPTFVVFDSDGDKPDKSGSRTKHEKDNRAILQLRGYADENPFPEHTFWAPDTVMWNTDIGSVVDSELGPGVTQILERVRSQFGNVGGLDKTAMFIAAKMAEAWEAGMRSKSLEKLCRAILSFATHP